MLVIFCYASSIVWNLCFAFRSVAVVCGSQAADNCVYARRLFRSFVLLSVDQPKPWRYHLFCWTIATAMTLAAAFEGGFSRDRQQLAMGCVDTCVPSCCRLLILCSDANLAVRPMAESVRCWQSAPLLWSALCTSRFAVCLACLDIVVQIVCSIYASFRFANAAVANSAPARANTNTNTNMSAASDATVSSMSMSTQTMNDRRAAHMKAVKSFMFYPLVCVICWYSACLCLCWCLLCVRVPLMGWFLNLYYQGDAAFILVYLNGQQHCSCSIFTCCCRFSERDLVLLEARLAAMR